MLSSWHLCQGKKINVKGPLGTGLRNSVKRSCRRSRPHKKRGGTRKRGNCAEDLTGKLFKHLAKQTKNELLNHRGGKECTGHLLQDGWRDILLVTEKEGPAYNPSAIFGQNKSGEGEVIGFISTMGRACKRETETRAFFRPYDGKKLLRKQKENHQEKRGSGWPGKERDLENRLRFGQPTILVKDFNNTTTD